MVRILIIDDDTELCTLLRELLEREGFASPSSMTACAGSIAAWLVDSICWSWISCCPASTDSRCSNGCA
jgi:CheY-like chemotaxis protein